MIFNRPIQKTSQRAFSLLEMMLVVSLLTIIVLGLYAMFDQTQKALRGSTAQVDVMEPGRAALDIVSRELEQIAASGIGDAALFTPNFLSRVGYVNPLKQVLIDGTIRSNILQDCFFLTRSNNVWFGNGFFVSSVVDASIDTAPVGQVGAGTLFRFVPMGIPPTNRLTLNYLTNIVERFYQAKLDVNQAFPVLDGVVHFRVRALDSAGRHIFASSDRNVMVKTDKVMTEKQIYFFSNAIPSFVELELGILEPQILSKANGIPGPFIRRQYLQKQVGAVHLFHELIPIRNAQQ